MQSQINSSIANAAVIANALKNINSTEDALEALVRVLNGEVDIPVTVKAAYPLMDAAVEQVWANNYFTGFTLEENPELYRQYGRACALLSAGTWTLVGSWAREEFVGEAMQQWLDANNMDIPVSTIEGSDTVKVRFLKDSDGRLIAATVAKNAKGTDVPEVYEWNAELGAWEYHRVTHTSRSKVFNYAAAVGEKHTAWTKYHILAMILSGARIAFKKGTRGDYMRQAEEAARRQAWATAGYDWRDYPEA